MKYKFPVINHIDQVREAIRGVDEFRLVEKDDYIVVNYFVNSSQTFPKVTDELTAIRRECRGIIFSKEGKVIARRYHKFFNLGERGDETMPNQIDFSQPHVILEKLDGSMITPFYSNDKLRMGTKMGYTDVAAPVEDWVFNPARKHYVNWMEWTMGNNLTPIFEWCSRSQRIVIDYPVDRLVLTAIRNNLTGEYVPYEQMVAGASNSGIEVVRALPGSVSNIEKLIEETKSLQGQEGWIIRFDDGHMLKLKADEYVRMHGTLDSLNQEKDIIRLILKNEIDDCKAFMHENDKNAVESFQNDLLSALNKKADELKWVYLEAKDNIGDSKKRFALEVVQGRPRPEQGLLYQIWDGKDPKEVVYKFVQDHTSTQSKVDSVRSLHGLKWWEYRRTKELE